MNYCFLLDEKATGNVLLLDDWTEYRYTHSILRSEDGWWERGKISPVNLKLSLRALRVRHRIPKSCSLDPFQSLWHGKHWPVQHYNYIRSCNKFCSVHPEYALCFNDCNIPFDLQPGWELWNADWTELDMWLALEMVHVEYIMIY